MAHFKFSREQFIGLAEWRRNHKFLDTDGFRRNILENSVSFGLIKSNADPEFSNGRVTRDVDTGGEKTIKIAPLNGIDSDGLFITNPSTINQIVVPNDGAHYWIKVKHAYTNEEQGTVSIAVNGTLTGTGTEFTKIFRGGVNTRSKIKFTNSLYNTREYEVGVVESDTSAWLDNPGRNTAGQVRFEPETDLKFKIVGTFTPGVAVSEPEKFPFNYDSMTYELVQETILNTPPSYEEGKEFYLARVKVVDEDVIVQDRRNQFYETKGSQLAIDIDRDENPLIGVESIQWQPKSNPASQSIVNVGWGMRSSNFTVDTSQGIVTLLAGEGGKYKDVSSFNDGDFNGWRLYTANGRYATVVSSVQAAGAINLSLDCLLIDDFSQDGGVSLLSQEIRCVPNAEEIEILVQCEPTDNAPSVSRTFTFAINDAVGKLFLEVYKDESVLYNIQYRLKSLKEFTEYRAIPSDEIAGYLVESNFNEFGVQSGTTRETYTSDATSGFIELQPCPWSYSNFQDLVYLGDKLDVYIIPDLAASATINLTVGVDAYYQKIQGTHAIATDTSFILGTGIKGNRFTIHIDAEEIDLGGNQIFIKQTDGITILKTINMADIYTSYNIDGGIVINLVHDGTEWMYSQNYELGISGELRMVDVPSGSSLSSLFDTTGSVNNAKGRVKGLWGWALCNHAGTVEGMPIPNLSAAFIVGQGTSPLDGTVTIAHGTTGGELEHTLTEAELPAITPTFAAAPHTHTFTGTPHGHRLFFRGREGASGSDWQGIQVDASNNVNLPYEDGSGSGAIPPVVYTAYIEDVTAGGTNSNETVTGTISSFGSGQAHNNLPPYYAAVYVKRLY